MKYFRATMFALGILSSVNYSLYSVDSNQDLISTTYQLMDHDAFRKIVVGNTVLGITRQSHSVYMVYFASDGVCELWKHNQVYSGTWRIEKDTLGRDCVRAFWPHYTSSEPQSLFSPENSRFGTATSVWYYSDSQQPNTILVATKKFRAHVILAPGRAFPALKSK